MTTLDLVIAPDQRLKTVAENIKTVDQSIVKLMNDMSETMEENNGIGLAANQVGVLKRVIVIKIQDDMGWQYEEEFPSKKDYIAVGDTYLMANPKITWASKERLHLKEGCLSIPGTQDNVSRPESIHLEYLDQRGDLCHLKAQRWLARCIQHEIDHLNGVLFVDHLSKMKRDMALKKSAKFQKAHQ